jgi:hypothetical protein
LQGADVKFHSDKAHGPFPDHMDVNINIEPGMKEKLRVDKKGNIISDDLKLSPYWDKLPPKKT